MIKRIKSYQIIALATKLEATKKALASTSKITALATGTGDNKPKRGKGRSYNIEPWHLIYQDDTVDKGKWTYCWCKEEHRNGGTAHHGMYATHAPGEHVKWRAELDAKKKGNPSEKLLVLP